MHINSQLFQLPQLQKSPHQQQQQSTPSSLYQQQQKQEEDDSSSKNESIKWEYECLQAEVTVQKIDR